MDPDRFEEEIEIIAEELETEYDLKVLNECWHISVHPKKGYECGYQELLMKQLKIIGKIEKMKVIPDINLSNKNNDKDACYQSFEINLRCDKTKNEIENIFKNVRNIFKVRILPPNSNISDYLELIEELSDKNKRIGEILKEIGSLTEMELEEVLSMQKEYGDKNNGRTGKNPQPLGELLVSEKMIQEPVLKAALKKQDEVRYKK